MAEIAAKKFVAEGETAEAGDQWLRRSTPAEDGAKEQGIREAAGAGEARGWNVADEKRRIGVKTDCWREKDVELETDCEWDAEVAQETDCREISVQEWVGILQAENDGEHASV